MPTRRRTSAMTSACAFFVRDESILLSNLGDSHLAAFTVDEYGRRGKNAETRFGSPAAPTNQRPAEHWSSAEKVSGTSGRREPFGGWSPLGCTSSNTRSEKQSEAHSGAARCRHQVLPRLTVVAGSFDSAVAAHDVRSESDSSFESGARPFTQEPIRASSLSVLGARTRMPGRDRDSPRFKNRSAVRKQSSSSRRAGRDLVEPAGGSQPCSGLVVVGPPESPGDRIIAGVAEAGLDMPEAADLVIGHVVGCHRGSAAAQWNTAGPSVRLGAFPACASGHTEPRAAAGLADRHSVRADEGHLGRRHLGCRSTACDGSVGLECDPELNPRQDRPPVAARLPRHAWPARPITWSPERDRASWLHLRPRFGRRFGGRGHRGHSSSGIFSHNDITALITSSAARAPPRTPPLPRAIGRGALAVRWT